jgi:hypothetical protein
MIMLDHQARSDASGFQHNGEAGKLIHGLLGWDKLVPESMATYQAGRPTFRLASKPEPEARMWMLDGIAGGLQPWWHHVSAYHEDRRMYRTAEPIYRWHEANERYLLDRRPIATVGLVWSQQNCDYWGRGEAKLMVEEPWRGMAQALTRARIPYLPVHAEDIERDAPSLSALLLPNVGAMSDAQVAAVRRFVVRGGGLLASGDSSRCDQWGDSLRQWNQPRKTAKASATPNSAHTATARSCGASTVESGAPAMRSRYLARSSARSALSKSALIHRQSCASRSKSQGESATAGAA